MFKLNYILFVVLLVAVAAGIYLYRIHQRKAVSKIIILNGAAASGKSSLQKELQRIMKVPYLRFGIDTLYVAPLPCSYVIGEQPKGDYSDADFMTIENLKDENGFDVVPLKFAKFGLKVIDGMHWAIKGYADAGNNLIIDYINYEPHFLDSLLKQLEGHLVFVIKVNVDLDVLEQREAARGTSPKGHSRSHFNTVHQGVKYDFVVDNTSFTSLQNAEKIKMFVEQE